MKQLPPDTDALVLRTDFSDDAAWADLRSAVVRPTPDGFQAYVAFLSDPEYASSTVEQLIHLARDTGRTYFFVVDTVTIETPERPILVIDLYDEPGRTFRVIPSEMASVENNLSIANMDFAEFADNTDPDGVFRGFD